ncbi:HK97 family phage prohead protease [Pseudonocardia hispaniensis]|uniref:HK97 family phage prohead protease n=1 Tax=Pseudonocardia hispaniensis TaxID=904933 RepID=A0ABW1IYN4_9PSEU
MDPTPLHAATRERRVTPLAGIEVRAADDDSGQLRFRGRAVVYNQLSDDLGGWRERIMPGAATRTLDADPDVRFVINHNPDLLLSRTRNGTLRLTQDDEGVLVDAEMANVSHARDLAVLLERGDITQMSFAFWITAHGWAGDVHEVYAFDLDGGDVSVVTYPAFPQTSAELASRAAAHLARPSAERPLALYQHRVRQYVLLAQA